MILDRFNHIFHLRDGRLERDASPAQGANAQVVPLPAT
jgi:hypothetical protein